MNLLLDKLNLIFEPELIKLFEEQGKVKSFPCGEIITHDGQPVLFIPILLEGILKISRTNENGKDLLLYYVYANQSCAMTFTCCMEQHPSEVKVTAESDVTVLLIPIGKMDEWMQKFPTWKSFILKTFRERFNELLHTIDQLAFQKLDERLVNFLREKSKATNSTIINLSHEEIATEIASSREVISRLLKKLENESKVILYRNQIKLLSSF